MSNRREFIATSLAAAVVTALPACARSLPSRDATGPATGKPLSILILGGTGFLGPHFVEAARARGHHLTLFNRGKSNPARFDGEAFSDIEQLKGDRKTDLSALEGDRRWDVVLDTSAYLPADVTRVASLLAPRVGHYQIISSVSVYARNDIANDETSPVAVLADPGVTEVNGETYGGLKALCEKAAETALPGRVSVIRPGLIVGPGDTTDRFTYWPVRADRGGEILAPGTPEGLTQVIDVRDLAAFMLHVIEQRNTAVFNADAPAGTLTMGAVLASCQRVAQRMNTINCVRAPCPQPPGHASTLTWVPVDVLKQQEVSPWQDLPAWIPAEGDYAGFGRTSTVRAQQAGLTYRALDETVADTLAWWRTLPEDRRAKPKAGLSPEREAAVLKAWHAKAG